MTPPNITEAARKCAILVIEKASDFAPFHLRLEKVSKEIQLAITTATAPLEKQVKELEDLLYAEKNENRGDRFAYLLDQRDALTQKLAMVEKALGNVLLAWNNKHITEEGKIQILSDAQAALNPTTQPTKEAE